MQAGRIGDDPFQAVLQIGGGFRGCRGLRHSGGQRCDDVLRIAGRGQLAQTGLVLNQAGEPFEDGDMSIRAGRDADHEPDALAGVPFDAAWNLQHRQSIAVHQMAVFDPAVRNGHAGAQEGIRQGLALRHAVPVPFVRAAAGGGSWPSSAMACRLSVTAASRRTQSGRSRDSTCVVVMICLLGPIFGKTFS